MWIKRIDFLFFSVAFGIVFVGFVYFYCSWQAVQDRIERVPLLMFESNSTVLCGSEPFTSISFDIGCMWNNRCLLYNHSSKFCPSYDYLCIIQSRERALDMILSTTHVFLDTQTLVLSRINEFADAYLLSAVLFLTIGLHLSVFALVILIHDRVDDCVPL